MPKRGTEEKLQYYKNKIRKLEQKKKRVRLYSTDSEPSEYTEVTGYAEPNVDMMTNEQSTETAELLANQLDKVQEILPPPHPISDLVLEQTEQNMEEISTPSIEVPTEPPLDPELLSALGACTSDTPDFGEDIHSSLANLWPLLLRKGLPKEDKDSLIKQYLVPANCRLLQAPKLNAEISAAVSEVVRGRDKKITAFQQELGAGISVINRGMEAMLKSDNKTVALKKISDGCRLLCNLHYSLTKDRSKLITPSLEKGFLHVLQETERDDTLFGSSLAEKIKASKAIERQSHQIRNKAHSKPSNPLQPHVNRPVQQGNWTGPPRYPSNRGGRGGRGRAASTTTRRYYPTTSTQTTKSSNQNKTRANNQ